MPSECAGRATSDAVATSPVPVELSPEEMADIARQAQAGGEQEGLKHGNLHSTPASKARTEAI